MLLSVFKLFQVSAQLVSKVFLCFGGWGWTTFVKHLQKKTMHLHFWKKISEENQENNGCFLSFQAKAERI